MSIKTLLSLTLLAAGMLAASAEAAPKQAPAPLVIQEQGSFAAGGTVISAKEPYDPLHPQAAGQTLHGDHSYVFYQKPVNARKYPLVFLHGAGQSARTWESTPDGREGFQNLFLRRGYSVYLVDQPRRGDAGRSTVSMNVEATPDEQFWFGQFRMGLWPNFFENTQFASGEKALDQFFRQMTPNTGPYDANVIADSMAALFADIGSGVLVTHSQGCGPGWLAAMKSENVRGIVAYEPGSGFVFPEGEAPKPIANASSFGPLSAGEVPLDQFMALTRIPIVIYYGDNIPAEPVSQPHQDYWRAALRMARLWADAVNRHGGDATVVHLPEAGIHGNTHFPFSDLNNEKVADALSQWLKEKRWTDAMNTWLITGCSSGLGKSLAKAVLEHGDQAIVTARNPETVQQYREYFPQTALPLQLDVTKEEEVISSIARSIERFGKIDVLVNNAGYCLRGAVEECSFEEIRKQFETNFFGTVRMIQHTLPHMRKQKNGTIINFSSIAALSTSEGSAFYGASKCAVEGLSDGLRKEVNPLGIKVMVVEPGPFKTDFFYRSIAVNEQNIEDYQHTVGKRKIRIKNLDDSVMKGWGDNDKAAQVIIKAVEDRESPFHLLLGSVAVQLAEDVFASRSKEVVKWKNLSVQTDVPL